MPEVPVPPAEAPIPSTSRGSAEVLRRMGRLLWLKVIGITAWNWAFFSGYFVLLRHPVYPVATMPLTPMDLWLPFQPAWLWPYLSLWFYVGIAPGLMLRVRELVAYGVWAAALCMAGLACFYLWPTAVPPMQPADVVRHAGFSLLQGVDAAGNACPSMHVASAVFTALWVDLLLAELRLPARWRWGNALWCAAIVYSTMAVKQHVFFDVLAGTALGWAFAAASQRARHLAWGPVLARPGRYHSGS